MNFQTRLLSENFGAEVLDVDLVQINKDMAEAILSTVDEHGLLLFRRQSLHDRDIYRLSAVLGPVEEPSATRAESAWQGFGERTPCAGIV